MLVKFERGRQIPGLEKLRLPKNNALCRQNGTRNKQFLLKKGSLVYALYRTVTLPVTLSGPYHPK